MSQGHRDPQTQRPRFSDPETNGAGDPETQGYKNTGTKKLRDPETQGSRDPGRDLEIQ